MSLVDEVHPRILVGFVGLNLSFSVYCRSLFVLLSCFLLTTVLSVVLPFTASDDYHFGVFKLFLKLRIFFNRKKSIMKAWRWQDRKLNKLILLENIFLFNKAKDMLSPFLLLKEDRRLKIN